MEKTRLIKYQIKKIELLDTSLSMPQHPLNNDVVFQFEVNLEHRINKEKLLIFVICSVSIFGESKENSFGTIRTSCIFEVQELASFYEEEKNQFDFPEQFVTDLNSIAISSIRGIMFSTFRGTFLHNALLPIIDPSNFKMT